MATATPPLRHFDRAAAQRRVRHPLQAVRGLIRRYVALEGAGVAILYLCLWFWIGLILDYGAFLCFGFDWIQELQGSSEVKGNTDWWIRVVLLVGLTGGLLALVALKVIWRLSREFRDDALALVLERRFPRELGDRLITAVEMADPAMAKKYGYSQELVDKTVQDAADRVERLPVGQVFNWTRLWYLGLYGLAGTVGMYLFVVIASSIWVLASEDNASPLTAIGRFHNVSAIWFERNILLQDSYWPRKCYLEVVRFHGSKKDANEMRVGKEELRRPDIQVRAFKWVVADSKVRGGWRPLRWSDLARVEGHSDRPLMAQYFDEGLPARVVIPPDWPGWIIDLDDLDSKVSLDRMPKGWQGKSAGFIHEARQKKDPEIADLNAAFGPYLDRLLDWRTWTMDRLEQQLNEYDGKVARALEIDEVLADLVLAASTVGLLGSNGGQEPVLAASALIPERFPGKVPQKGSYEALRQIFKKLEKLAAQGGMSRTLRMLPIPERVYVSFRGQTTKSEEPVHWRADNGNKFAISTSELKESVRFTVQAEDYYTPSKKIALVAPPSFQDVSADIEAPAYLYYRVPGPQPQLAGWRQKFHARASTTGETAFPVPFRSSLTITARCERDLKKGSVRIKRPDGAKEGTLVPNVTISEIDAKSFSIHLDNVTKTYDFTFDYEDEDNVFGRRRVKVQPKDDAAPLVENFELAAVLRKPKFKEATPGAPTDAYLITPDALVPFKGTVSDEVALTQVQWEYAYRQIEIELIDQMKKDKAPTLILQGNTKVLRQFMDAGGAPLAPGANGLALVPAYAAWTAKLLEEKAAIEGLVPMEDFGKRLFAGKEVKLPDVRNLLTQALKTSPLNPSAEFPKRHQLYPNEAGFDFKTFLPKLKGEGVQLHYDVTVGVLATDNNIDRPYFGVKGEAQGVILDAVERDSRAAQAGLKPGDVLLRVDEVELTPSTEVVFLKKNPGDLLTVTLKRGPKILDIPYRLPVGKVIFPGAIINSEQVVLKGMDAKSPAAQAGLKDGDLLVKLDDFRVASTGGMYDFLTKKKPGDVVVVAFERGGKPAKCKVTIGHEPPSSGRFLKGPYRFLVVSQNELLSQIFLEEENLREKLEKVVAKLNDAKVNVNEQISKVAAPDFDLEVVSINVDQVRKALSDTASVTREIANDYNRILNELRINRVTGDKIPTVETKIVEPLELIVRPNGSYELAEESVQRLFTLIGEDIAQKRHGNPDSIKQVRDAKVKVDRLVEDLDEVLNQMAQIKIYSQVVEMLVIVERSHRNVVERLQKFHEEKVREVIEGLLKDKKKTP